MSAAAGGGGGGRYPKRERKAPVDPYAAAAAAAAAAEEAKKAAARAKLLAGHADAAKRDAEKLNAFEASLTPEEQQARNVSAAEERRLIAAAGNASQKVLEAEWRIEELREKGQLTNNERMELDELTAALPALIAARQVAYNAESNFEPWQRQKGGRRRKTYRRKHRKGRKTYHRRR